MIYTNNMSIVESKRFFSTCRQIVNNLILFFGLLGFTYLVFWFGGMTDYSIIERGETLFGPLATLIFPNSDAIDIYRNTGLISLALMLPVGFMYYVINKVENIIVHAIDKQNEIAAKKEKQQQFLDSLKEFDVIKSYSLCLSIDYESKKEF